MKTSLPLCALLLLSALGLGCGAKNDFDFLEIWACHQQNALDKEAVQSTLVGTWDWKYVVCCGETTKPYQNGRESKGLRIEFRSDSTGLLIEEGNSEPFVWTIEEKPDGFSLETTPLISQTWGRLWFCDGVMMCNGAVLDGADNYFVKAD